MSEAPVDWPAQLIYPQTLADFFLYFMTSFRFIEAGLNSNLMMESRLVYGDYVILFGHPKLGDLVTKLRKIYLKRARHTDLFPKLSGAFNQLRKLIDLRDQLIHCGFVQLPDGRIQINMHLNLKSAATDMPYEYFTMEEISGTLIDLFVIEQTISAYTRETAYPDVDAARRAFWKSTPELWRFSPRPTVARPVEEIG